METLPNGTYAVKTVSRESIKEETRPVLNLVRFIREYFGISIQVSDQYSYRSRQSKLRKNSLV